MRTSFNKNTAEIAAEGAAASSAGSSSPQRSAVGRRARTQAADAVARVFVYVAGWMAIVILAAIMVFLVNNSLPAIRENGLSSMIAGQAWYPTGTPQSFGFLPSEVGSAWVTLVALLSSVPMAVAAAVFISEFASGRIKDLAKTIVEFMAAIPSVVLGMIGIFIGVPLVKDFFGLSSGLTAFTAGVFVGIMALPTIVSISEDALHAVPESLRQGSLALGNTRWQTTYKVVIPAASSGIFASVMLGLGRAIGETMVVLMLAGNAGIIPTTPFESVRTLPGTIANEMGEVVQGGLHYSTLFAMGLFLFFVTFVINLAADVVLERQRKRWRR